MAPLLHVTLASAAAFSLGLACAGCTPQSVGNSTPPDSAGSGASKGATPPKEGEVKKEPERIPVKIAGTTFKLEPALDDPTRTKGLGGRTEIAEDGGMVFVFTDIQRRDFVMRDCPIPIDIIYLDGAGRVLTTHAMVPEEPRKPDESEGAYEMRLARYPSRFPTGLVVELKGGKIKELGVKPGDKLDFDIEALKKRAK